MASKRKLTKPEIKRLTAAVSFDQYTRAHAATNTYHTHYFCGVWTASEIMKNILLEIGVVEIKASIFVGTSIVLSSQGYQWLSDNGYLVDFEAWASEIAQSDTEAIEYAEYKLRTAKESIERFAINIRAKHSVSFYQMLTDMAKAHVVELEAELAGYRA